MTQLLVLGLAIQNLFVARWDKGAEVEKGEELGSIMAPESMMGGAGIESGKTSPEMHIYGGRSP